MTPKYLNRHFPLLQAVCWDFDTQSLITLDFCEWDSTHNKQIIPQPLLFGFSSSMSAPSYLDLQETQLTLSHSAPYMVVDILHVAAAEGEAYSDTLAKFLDSGVVWGITKEERTIIAMQHRGHDLDWLLTVCPLVRRTGVQFFRVLPR